TRKGFRCLLSCFLLRVRSGTWLFGRLVAGHLATVVALENPRDTATALTTELHIYSRAVVWDLLAPPVLYRARESLDLYKLARRAIVGFVVVQMFAGLHKWVSDPDLSSAARGSRSTRRPRGRKRRLAFRAAGPTAGRSARGDA